MSLKIKKFQLNSSNLTKNIVREIMRELDDHPAKQPIEKSFVEYVVDLMALDPNNGIDFNKSIINRTIIEEFIGRCISRLTGLSELKVFTKLIPIF